MFQLFISCTQLTNKCQLLHGKVVLTEHVPHLLSHVHLLLPGDAARLPVHPLHHVQQPLVRHHFSAKLEREIFHDSAKQGFLFRCFHV